MAGSRVKAAAKAVGSKADEAAEDASPSKYLIGATAVVAGVFTTLQVTGSLFSRMLANYPVWVGVAMLLAGTATALAFIALIFNTWFTKGLLFTGVLLVLAGTTSAVIAALLVYSEEGKPIVAITKLEERELEATVKVLNVKTDETVRVRVEPLIARSEKGEGLQFKPPESIRSIYEAALGPDASGNVEQTISVDLPSIEFTHVGVRAWVGDNEDEDCYAEASKTTGCVTREVVFGQERPQLSAHWDFAATLPRLVINVSGQGLRRNGYGYLRLRALKGGPELASWAVATNATGSFERTLQAKVPASVDTVCVEASMLRLPSATCDDKRNQQELSWVKLAVPEPDAEEK